MSDRIHLRSLVYIWKTKDPLSFVDKIESWRKRIRAVLRLKELPDWYQFLADRFSYYHTVYPMTNLIIFCCDRLITVNVPFTLPLLPQLVISTLIFLPPTNEVWGKIMFYTCLSVHRWGEGVCPTPPPGSRLPLNADPPGCRPPFWMQIPLLDADPLGM